MSQLSEHDRAILNCVFNPNLPLDEAIASEIKTVLDIEENTPEVEKTKSLEINAINLAEKGELESALEIINKAITIAPKRASLYNNRAHILQFQRKFSEAFDDLTTAIYLAKGTKLEKTLSQAYCQRGILNRRAENIDDARNDFENAAKLGNKFAKTQLVELNPYAALCNQMLKQVMDGLK